MATNRNNRGGPKTAAGKLRSRYNALQHGLRACSLQPVPAGDLERLARALCGDDYGDPSLVQAAVAVAENEFVLTAIRRQKIVVIERLHEATAIALRKGDNSFTVAKARFLQAWLADREIQRLVPKVMEKYRDQLLPELPQTAVPGSLAWQMEVDEIVPISVKALLEEAEPTDEEYQCAVALARQEIRRQQRSEYEALEEAVPDLIRLERYERRAWARQKRAINEFLNVRFLRRIDNERGTPSTIN